MARALASEGHGRTWSGHHHYHHQHHHQQSQHSSRRAALLDEAFLRRRIALQVLLHAPDAIDAFILGSPSTPFDPELVEWMRGAAASGRASHGDVHRLRRGQDREPLPAAHEAQQPTSSSSRAIIVTHRGIPDASHALAALLAPRAVTPTAATRTASPARITRRSSSRSFRNASIVTYVTAVGRVAAVGGAESTFQPICVLCGGLHSRTRLDHPYPTLRPTIAIAG